MKKTLHALTCVAYIVFAATAMTPQNTNHTRTIKIYEKLSRDEQLFFISLSGETLNAGYYSQLKGFSHKVEVAHMRRIVEQNVRTMKRSGQYRSILRKAGTGQQYIAQYLEWCHRLGQHHARHANSDKNRRSIRPRDIHASLYEEKVPPELTPLPHLPSGEQVMRVLSTRVLFIGFLTLLTLAAITGLIGACICPQLPVFGRLRTLLEY